MNNDESALVPARNPRIVSRRSMLGGLGLGSLSTMVLPLLGTATPAAAATRTKHHTHKVGDATGNYTPVTPYLTQASCTLTEDYFLTDEVLIDLDGGGKILPFTTKDGASEALILTGSGASRAVSYLARDNSTAAGWTQQTIPHGLPSVVSAAVYGSQGTTPQLLVHGVSGSGTSAASVVQYLTLGDDGWTRSGGAFFANKNTVGVKSGLGPAGQFFYSWSFDVEAVGVAYKSALRVMRYYLNNNEMTPQVVLDAFYSSTTMQIDDLVMRYDPAGKDGWIVFRYEGAFMRGLQIAPNGFQIPPLAGITENWLNTPNLEALVGIYGSGPDVVWQDTAGQITISLDGGKGTVQLCQTAGSDPSSVSAWLSDGMYKFAFCLDGVINSVTQMAPSLPVLYGFTPPIPMLAGITNVFGVETDPSSSTLFAVDLDGGLSVMSYGPTGWTDGVVHGPASQPSATPQEITCWQCQVTVTDDNGIGVPGATVQVTTDRPVAVWQDGETDGSSTTLVPGTPASFTTDIKGQLVLALPTNELDSAQLTVQALDVNGNPSGSPLKVGPDFDVQGFLTGTGSLDSVGGPLNGGALTNAKNLTWDTATQTYQSSGPLFTGIANLHPDQQPAAADACALAIMHVANLPTTTPKSASDVRSACLDLTVPIPMFTSSLQENAFTLPGTVDTSWWVKAQNDINSFFHGLRHGTVHVHKMVSSWVDKGSHWLVSLLVTLEDDLQHAVNFVVDSAQTAIHAISSFFQALGADIEKAWNWLKNLVGGIIAEAEEGAKVMEAWIAQLGSNDGPLMTALNNTEKVVDGWFTGLESKIDGYISNMIAAVGEKTFGDAAPAPSSSSDTGSSIGDINLKDLTQAVSVLQKCSPMYWIHKLEKHLPLHPSDGGPGVDIDFSATVNDLLTALGDVTEALEAVEDTFVDAFKAMFASRDALHATPLATIYQILQATETDGTKVVHYLLGALDKIADAVFDLAKAAVAAISDFFSYEFQMVPLIGGLLDHFGIDTKVSIQHLFCLVAAFPTAVIYRAIGYQGDMFPPQTDDQDAVHAWAKNVRTAAKAKGHPVGDSNFADPWGVALSVPSIPVQLAWMGGDVAVDVGTSNTVTTIVGTAAPLLMNIFGWPSKPFSGGNTGYPFRGGIDTTSTDWGIVPGIIINEFAPPMSNLVGLGLAKFASKSVADQFNDWASPVISTLSGIIGGVLGGTWAGVNKSDLGIEEAVIGNVSYITGVLGLPPLKDNPYAKVGKTIADGVGDFSTAILYMYAFSAAADG